MVGLTRQLLKTHIYTSFPRGAGVTVQGLANAWPLGFRAVLDLSWCVGLAVTGTRVISYFYF